MPGGRESIVADIDSELLSELRALARKEGRPLEALLEEALVDLVARRRKAAPRPHVMETYFASHKKYGFLYKKLSE